MMVVDSRKETDTAAVVVMRKWTRIEVLECVNRRWKDHTYVCFLILLYHILLKKEWSAGLVGSNF